MKKQIFTTILCCLILTLPAFSIEDSKKDLHCDCAHHHHFQKAITVKTGDTLTVLDCIEIGLKNSPVIKERAYILEATKSNVGVAKSAFFPDLSVGAGFRQQVNSNRTDFERDYRELPYVGVALNQMIWDFGKTMANIRMHEFLTIAATYEFEDAICSTVFNIKRHYYNLLKAKSEYETQKMLYSLQESIIKEMKALKKPKTDILMAETERAKIKSDLLIKEDEYKNAQEALNNAMFFEDAPKYNIFETQSFTYAPTNQNIFKNIFYKKTDKIAKDNTIFQHPKYSYNQAVSIAYKNSPDLHALIATRNAMEQSLISVKRNYYPELNAGVGYEFLDTNKTKNNNGLTVAVGLEASINGMRQKYDVKGAKAQLNIAETGIVTFKKNLYFTVRKCINSAETTYQNIPVAKYQMEKATENFNETFKNYRTNIMNQYDLDYARRLYQKALYDYISSQYEYNIALINLEQAMHEHLIDYHDDAEHVVEYHQGDENNTLGKLIRCNKKHKHNQL